MVDAPFQVAIPVRFGVVVVSLIGLIVGVAIAVGGVIQANRSSGNKLAYIHTNRRLLPLCNISTSGYTLSLLLGITSNYSFYSCSLVGAILKQHGSVKAYLAVLAIHILFSFHPLHSRCTAFSKTPPDEVTKCINDPTDALTIQACQKASDEGRICCSIRAGMVGGNLGVHHRP
ncbi:hypothetical protein MVEN_00552300 [Mycena venus]|uniref:Uncharacterized protein n=1 Tax=Mycena venus TaxID=2733690 RepID=A0A8H7D7B6_9AGAR|nr:hypothetical protein MVEN_00552300 [Mycena venus]